jgi:hypothetical protein
LETPASVRLVVTPALAVVVDEAVPAVRVVVRTSNTLQEVLTTAAPLVVTLLGAEARLDANLSRRRALSQR